MDKIEAVAAAISVALSKPDMCAPGEMCGGQVKFCTCAMDAGAAAIAAADEWDREDDRPLESFVQFTDGTQLVGDEAKAALEATDTTD